MKKRKRSITIVLGLVALMILNLQAGNEKPASIIIQIEISKNGQVFIAEEPVKIGDIEQVAKDILKATPEAIFNIYR